LDATQENKARQIAQREIQEDNRIKADDLQEVLANEGIVLSYRLTQLILSEELDAWYQ